MFAVQSCAGMVMFPYAVRNNGSCAKARSLGTQKSVPAKPGAHEHKVKLAALLDNPNVAASKVTGSTWKQEEGL